MRSSFRRAAFLLISALLLCPVAARAQRSASPSLNRPSDVDVRITYENDRPASGQIRVQLLTITGSTMGEQFTRDQGQVTFHNVFPGNYRIHASGIDIEDSDSSFTIQFHESTHFEILRVKPKQSEARQAALGTVSSAVLNIPDKARKEFDKGISAMKKDDIPEAERRFSKAAEIYPQYSAALNNLGVLAMKSRKAEEGKAFFAQAVQADGSNPNGYTNLARCLMMERKAAEAEPMLVKAISLNPTDAESLTLLADAQLVNGKLDAAISSARKVHSLEHQRFAAVHLVAANAYEQKNQIDAAIAEYKLYLKESPDSPKAAAVRAALQTLETRVK